MWALHSVHLSAKTPLTGARADSVSLGSCSYVRFVGEGATVALSDSDFFQSAGRVVFPVNQYYLPRDSRLARELVEVVVPLVNRDSMELVGLIMRGAASPEGPTGWNRTLGELRCKALFDFVNQHLLFPGDEEKAQRGVDVEDYRSLCLMMRQADDPDYEAVQRLCDRYLPTDDYAPLKRQLQQMQGGRLWRRLLRHYFPQLRTARVMLFFRKVHSISPIRPASLADRRPGAARRALPAVPADSFFVETVEPRRELLSVKTNLLLDLAYMPGYNRWCPIPNVAVEYYPRGGHFTFGGSFDFPWWRHYEKKKYFQVRNYQLETRYYLRPGDERLTPRGTGAAFRGFYLQAYAHAAIYCLCFDANRGWIGEGFGGGVGCGYVVPLSRSGHWRLELQAQVGFFTTKYDPFQHENPVDEHYRDNLYYYKWTLKPEQFKQRQYRYNWFGPTRVGITLSYDLLYRRHAKRGVSFRSGERRVIGPIGPLDRWAAEERRNAR